MAYPAFSSEFILTTDSPKVAVAAIMSQVQNGVERPVSYASRQMNIAEQNYFASEAEMLAWLGRQNILGVTFKEKGIKSELITQPWNIYIS